jgi:hypothetical protein
MGDHAALLLRKQLKGVDSIFSKAMIGSMLARRWRSAAQRSVLPRSLAGFCALDALCPCVRNGNCRYAQSHYILDVFLPTEPRNALMFCECFTKLHPGAQGVTRRASLQI